MGVCGSICDSRKATSERSDDLDDSKQVQELYDVREMRSPSPTPQSTPCVSPLVALVEPPTFTLSAIAPTPPIPSISPTPPVQQSPHTIFILPEDKLDTKTHHRIALKAPHKVQMQSIVNSSAGPVWTAGDDINVWIKNLYAGQKLLGWIVYNDEVDGHSVSSTHGHCKGVVTWTSNKICWLIHSVPKFPSSFDGFQIPDIAQAECIYAQSFAFIDNIPLSCMNDILIQLRIMNAYVYIATIDLSNVRTNNPMHKDTSASVHLREIDLGEGIAHIATSRLWGQDIYEHLSTHETYAGSWIVETWVRGQECKDTDRVKDAHQITWSQSPHNYKRTQDHSKYACSQTHVCIGDKNRMNSQKHRGGGAIVFENESIAQLFGRIMRAS